ncbi:trypsin alpha-3-like [Drosophila subpulchrella]|uniref:trypsin alpha-3-like n=1 Tax=Drosophila subpulchrella TaxID=1486046 RepID=UPI0018A16998|nr:trypsin alpha-3-like [Drosophila subpulchrella]
MLQSAGILLLTFLSWSTAEVAKNGSGRCSPRGKAARVEEVPWIASIQSNNTQLCSGAIINPKFVLITANCLTNVNITTVKVLVGNPDRDSGSSFGDDNLSLLKLCEPLTTSAKVKAIDIIDKQPEEGARGSVAGWGSLTKGRFKSKDCWAKHSKVLRKTDVQLLDIKECATRRKKSFSKLSLSDANICSEKRDFSCSYDAGSPLVIDGKLAGIITAGTCLRKPEIYASLYNYRKWIETSTKDK